GESRRSTCVAGRTLTGISAGTDCLASQGRDSRCPGCYPWAMIRYLDSGYGGPNECLGLWLDQELTADTRSFRGQFGFYDGAALRKYTPNLAAMLARGGTL